MSYPTEVRLMAGPLTLWPVQVAAEPDDAPNLRVAIYAGNSDKPFVRGAWAPEAWAAVKDHPRWQQPFMVLVSARREDPGIVLHLHLIVPPEMLPNGLVTPNPDAEGEAWRGETAGTAALLPVGMLVRYEHAFRHGGELPAEAIDLLERAASGGTVEPFEQGLGL